MSQLHMSSGYRFDALNLGVRLMATALRVGFVCKVPHPNPLPRGEGACRTAPILLAAQSA